MFFPLKTVHKVSSFPREVCLYVQSLFFSINNADRCFPNP